MVSTFGKIWSFWGKLQEKKRITYLLFLPAPTHTYTGNVPANYRTNDNPPRALGRWINRQRSAYGKDKLKSEYIEKLNKIGLKWSVHERRPVLACPDAAPSSTCASNNNNNSGGDSTSEVENKESSDGTVKEENPVPENAVSSTVLTIKEEDEDDTESPCV
jgi:hypothetical protein